jgi:hypothetical protein
MEAQAGCVPFRSNGMRGISVKRALGIVMVALAPFVDAQTGPIDPAYARAYFSEFRELDAADGGRMWGKEIGGPMMFVDAATRTIVASEGDTHGILHEEKGVWIGTLPSQVNPANTAIDLGGKRWSMVLWPVSDSRYSRRRLLMHESFHRIQSDLGIPASDPSNAHLATLDGRIWTRLEMRALTEALLRSGELRKSALRDALIFRARRRSLSPGAGEDERKLELNEGLAEYTGLALSGLPRSSLTDRVAVQLAQSEQQENFARSFAYATGPAYALLLDAAGNTWRRRIRASSDLSTMVASAYGVTGVDAGKADVLVDRYTGSRMVAEERAKQAKRAENEKRIRARFIDGARLTLPVGNSFSFSYDPNGVTPLPGVGSYYESSRITDEWGVLAVSSGGVLLLRNESGAITGIVVSGPSTSNQGVAGEGWTLTLTPGWVTREGSKKGDMVVKKNLE